MGEDFNETKLYLDYDDLWNSYSDDKCILLCFSQRDITVLLAGLRYAEYSTRWLDSDGRRLRDTGRLADLVTAINYIKDLERRLMADCGTQFLEGLTVLGESIKAGLIALANKPCCPTSVNVNIVQGSTEGGNTTYGTKPHTGQGNAETDPPPDGFETWEQFNTYKCQAANWVADSLIATYRNLGVLQLSTIAIGSVAVGAALGGLITFIPPAAIVLLIGGLVGLGISLTVVNAVGDWLSDHRDDVVCMLYGSGSTTAAIDGFWGLVNEALEEITVAASVVSWVKQVTLALLTTDLLETLFTNSLQANYPDADCSNCDDIQECVLLDFADSETNGFIDFPDAFDDLPTPPATRDVVPTSTGLQVSATAASGQRVVIVDNTSFGLTIVAGMSVIQKYTNLVSVSSSIRVYLVTNVANRVFYNTHGQGHFEHTNSLTPFAGETIERVVLTVNSNGGNVQVLWESVEIACP